MDRFLCLPTCWDDDLIVELGKRGIHNKVHELYGSLDTSIVGSGRASFILPKVSPEQAANHIQKAHALGIKFDYLLNASCMGNREFEKEGQKKIFALLDWLNECNVDTVTVSIPYLVEIIRKYFPRMAINVSTIAHVDSVQKAKFWKGLGADRITVDFMMNRDLEFIENVHKAVKCELEVIVHDLCLYGCPFRYYHYNTMAHASQEVEDDNPLKHRLAISYPLLKCNLIKLNNFAEIIKIRWIRPEDIKTYRKLGVSLFKLVDRARPKHEILFYAKAYAEEAYKGNLLDIMPILPAGMKEAGSSDKKSPIYVDNTKLDGFLDFFKSSKCRTDCYECSYCSDVAEKVVRVTDREYLEGLIDFLNQRLESITDWEGIIHPSGT
jgi:collagenase-like PrtC family protease